MTQQPAASVPCGLTAAGLPIGLQIVGPRHADALVLRAARAYERSVGRSPLPRLQERVQLDPSGEVVDQPDE
jgi:aspartyl-tRNA(Asn)/glutamyl-tRNA(Gln) amidotransferase subunit A